MTVRFVVGACAVALCSLGCPTAHGQDVPGVEICTVEKTMERRTSCLQSNIEFLHKTIARFNLEHQQKLEAAKAQIEALRANVTSLQKVVDDLQAAQRKMAEELNKKADVSPPKEAGLPKDAAKGGKEGAK